MSSNSVEVVIYARSHPALRWLPVWQRNLLVWVKLAGPAILGNFGEPLLYLLALGYGLGAFVENMSELPYLVFLASGTVCSSAMSTSSFEGMYSAYTRMAVQNTWGAMLATPLGVSDVVLGETAWAATKSLISSTAILIVAALLGAVAGPQALLVLPLVVLIGLCFGAMALVVTAVSRSYDFFLYYTTLFITPSLLIGGVFFPLERMPVAIQWLASVLPLTHAVEIVRPLMTGLPLQNVGLHLAVVLGYTVVSLALAIHLIRRRLSA
jgi:lipooligosaccharide transport system permease protein